MTQEKCVDNTLIEEKICCRKPKLLSEDDFESKICITMSDVFQTVCLDKYVFKIALATWNDFHHDIEHLEKKHFRFIAYKQYIPWTCGYLGKKKRRHSPCCVILAIRRTFPELSELDIQFSECK